MIDSTKTDICVIGAGSGGLSVAARAPVSRSPSGSADEIRRLLSSGSRNGGGSSATAAVALRPADAVAGQA